jgi:excisionase family DNA binding protein
MTILIVCLCSVSAWAITATVWGFGERGLRKAAEEERDWFLQAAKSPLTVQELAAQKRVSVSTVARLAREGKIKAEKVGRQWRISQTEGE